MADLRDQGFMIFEGFLDGYELDSAQEELWLYYPRPEECSADLRLYEAELWAKYARAVDYDQRHHRDFVNHSLVGPKRSQSPTQMPSWILLSDVGDEDGPTKIVPLSVGEIVPYWPIAGNHDITNDPPAGMSAAEEVSMTGPAGALFAFRTDVLHRGSRMTGERSSRFALLADYEVWGPRWTGRVAWAERSTQEAWFEIRTADITRLVEEAVLATFEHITLSPSHRKKPDVDQAARVGLAATLDADRERLAQLDDDHYDGLTDKAMWVRQRARIAERIEATRREYTATLPEQTGPGIDMTTVAAEWAGRTPMWQYQAASLILQAVLVHALPDGMNGATPARRRNETVQAFHTRRTAHRANVLARRVEFVWRA